MSLVAQIQLQVQLQLELIGMNFASVHSGVGPTCLVYYKIGYVCKKQDHQILWNDWVIAILSSIFFPLAIFIREELKKKNKIVKFST